ncbi:MAG: type II secretion system F family protein [Plesiomonas shigelloides]
MKNISLHDMNIRFAFNATKRIDVYRAMASLLKSGVSLNDTLNELVVVYSGSKNSKEKIRDPVALIMQRILSELDSGTRSIAELFKPWVPEYETMILKAADNIGPDSLPIVLDDLIYSIKMRMKISSIVAKAVAYPVVLFSGAIGLLMMYATEVIPKLATISPQEAWPTSSHMLFALANGVHDAIYLILVSFFTVYFLFFFSLSRWAYRLPRLRIWLDQYPPYGFYKMLNGSGFMLSLSIMIKAGMSMNDALRAIKSVSPPWLESRIQGALYSVERGKSLGESLQLSGYDFPSTKANRFITLLAKSPDGLSTAMYVFAKDWMEDSISKLASIATVIFFAGILAVGALIVLILLGQYGMSDALINAA